MLINVSLRHLKWIYQFKMLINVIIKALKHEFDDDYFEWIGNVDNMITNE